MPNRVEIDIQGAEYTFAINPIEYQGQLSFPYSLEESVMGDGIRFEPFYDDRKRVMTWRDLPDKANYRELAQTLRSAIGISGVRLNYRDLNISGDQDQWINIVVENVNIKFRDGVGPLIADSHMSFDMDFVYSI